MQSIQVAVSQYLPEGIMHKVVVAIVTMGLFAQPFAQGHKIKRRDFYVPSDMGVRLFVREVRDMSSNFMKKKPLVLIHGARVPGIASFDLPVSGGSLAADLAVAGYVVYVMDARGYGSSTKPPEMSQSPELNRPLVRSSEVVRDIAAVVEAIRQRSGVDRVALLGWATGGHWAGQYASIYTHRVSHLILYNTLYGSTPIHPTLGRGSDLEDPQRPGRFNTGRYGAYRFNTAESLLPSWDRSIPIEDKSQWRDPAVMSAYQQAAIESDPTARQRTPSSFRAPSGALEDSFYLATGRRLWDASLVRARTLIIRSERDFWSRPEDPKRLAEDLVHAAGVKVVTIAGATHHVHLDRAERGRDRFLQDVISFLSDDGE
jgi:pimeloyl-ACP methyl ester carboxylesterase